MRSTRSRINVTVILLVILVLGAIGGAGYMYMQNKKLKKDVQTAKDQKDGKISNEELLRKIGEHIVLPSNETPAILTVDDKDKLKDQPFFKPAENGDKIIIYTQAKKAIIYREAWNKIIDVGPVSVDAKDAAKASTPTPTPTPQEATPNP